MLAKILPCTEDRPINACMQQSYFCQAYLVSASSNEQAAIAATLHKRQLAESWVLMQRISNFSDINACVWSCSLEGSHSMRCSCSINGVLQRTL